MRSEQQVEAALKSYEDVDSWKTIIFLYNAALKEVGTKLEILNDEFQHVHQYNPIEHIKTRIKTPDSIVKKLKRYGHETSIENMVRYVNDIAGVRLICSFTSDIYRLAEMIGNQSDLKVLSIKDYIKNPKESGYKSYHMLVSVPIFLSDSVVDTKVEIQIRTIAMDFWASLEHKIYYKFEGNAPEYISKDLQECAKMVSELDDKMLSLNEAIRECIAQQDKDQIQMNEELMNDVKTLVIDKYDGSLKAEHGTGRNMAPFVKYEWGEKAYRMMQAVKTLFDPLNILNPGVIFNDDPQCHIKNFKPLPLLGSSHRQPAENNKSTPDIGPIDKCIECGFCEVNCLTCGFTLSSRQRIVLQREISRLKESGENPQRLATLQKQYRYPGNQTCAGDGLCSTSCPMGINTGDLTHYIRQQELPEGSFAYSIGNFAANHFAGIKSSLRPMLTLANATHTVLGTSAMLTLTTGMHNLLGIPQWTPFMPKSYKRREKGDLSREKEREESQSDSNTGSQLSTFNSQLSTAFSRLASSASTT